VRIRLLGRGLACAAKCVAVAQQNSMSETQRKNSAMIAAKMDKADTSHGKSTTRSASTKKIR
jgi:hypothetical protein